MINFIIYTSNSSLRTEADEGEKLDKIKSRVILKPFRTSLMRTLYITNRQTFYITGHYVESF